MLRNLDYLNTGKIIKNVPFTDGSNIIGKTQMKKCNELYKYMMKNNLSEIDYNFKSESRKI